MKVLNVKAIVVFLLLLAVPSFSYALTCAPDHPNCAEELGWDKGSSNKDDVIIGLVVVSAALLWYFYEPEESVESKMLQLKPQEEEKDYSFSVVPTFNDSSEGVTFSFGYKY